MTATSNNTQALTYRELQAKLKELRDNRYDVQCKLNAKQEVLQQEFDRLTATLVQEVQEILDSPVSVLEYNNSQGRAVQEDTVPSVGSELATLTNNTETTDTTPAPIPDTQYPFNSYMGVKVENRPELYHQAVLPALNAQVVPSWLSKQHKVYWIDRVDYLPSELECWLRKHKGECCELPHYSPVIQPEQETALEVEQAQNRVSPQPVSRVRDKVKQAWQRYHNALDSTCKQALDNGITFSRNTAAFLQGFVEGLSETGRRNHKAMR